MILFQLNIYHGAYMPALLRYLRENPADIIQLQEVSGGIFSKSGDNLTELAEVIGFPYKVAKCASFDGDDESYMANVTFVHPRISIQKSEIMWMKEHGPIQELPLKDFENWPRNALYLELSENGKPFSAVNTHMVWGEDPYDKPYKTEQHNMLVEFMKTLKNPWILSGDFNVTPQSKLITGLNTFSTDWAKSLSYPNTLNPRTHRVKTLFPKGLAVDYVFTSPQVRVKEIKLVDAPDLSDHFGYLVTFDL